MKTHPHLLAVFLLASAAAFAGAAAQTADQGLDLEAIRARAAQEAGEAEALAASARARAEQLAREAKSSADAAEAHGRRFASEAPKSARPDPAQTFDFDAMVADAGAMAGEGMGEAPRFVAFASTSMPPAALRTMIDDVTRAGGVVVLRGLPNNSAKALTAALSKIARQGEQPGCRLRHGGGGRRRRHRAGGGGAPAAPRPAARHRPHRRAVGQPRARALRPRFEATVAVRQETTASSPPSGRRRWDRLSST